MCRSITSQGLAVGAPRRGRCYNMYVRVYYMHMQTSSDLRLLIFKSDILGDSVIVKKISLRLYFWLSYGDFHNSYCSSHRKTLNSLLAFQHFPKIFDIQIWNSRTIAYPLFSNVLVQDYKYNV